MTCLIWTFLILYAVAFKLYDLRGTGYIEKEEVIIHAFSCIFSKEKKKNNQSACHLMTANHSDCVFF